MLTYPADGSILVSRAKGQGSNKKRKREKEMTKREEIIRQFAELIGAYVGTTGNFEAYLAIDGEDVQMDVRASGSFGEVDRSETFITRPLGVMYWADILDEWFGGAEDITAKDNYEDFIEDVIVPMIENQLEGVRNKRYLIRDAEAGNPIESFDTYQEAQEMIYTYEMEDMNDFNFTEGFYEIYDTEEFEILESEGRKSDDYDSFMEQLESK